ncbi:MAG: transketolase [bacterium]
MAPTLHDIDQTCVNTIRTLSMDAVQAADSGHPGAPMGMAPMAYCLWQRVLRFDPGDPLWPNRDRFVLSAGHASMLLYSLIHLAGHKEVKDGQVTDRAAVTLDDIKAFRQIDSRCAGHPEHGLVTGVETTAGPLGQGVSNSVGMALAGRWLAARYNRPGFALFDYDVYALAGDGCMQEGISAEAASFAGHFKLSNLCWIWDNNRITIDGSTALTWSDDMVKRFGAHGWRVEVVNDANDLAALEKAYAAFKAETERPTLIAVASHIAYGAPHKQDTSDAHGAPLGEDEIKLAKKSYGWPEDAKFLVPDGVPESFATGLGARGRRARDDWKLLLEKYQAEHPELAKQVHQIIAGELPEGWDADLPTYEPGGKNVATRGASGQALNTIAPHVPWLLGGSADLAPSNKTHLSCADAGVLSPDNPGGRNMHFGIREHAMAAIGNGMALCGLRPYVATFLIFSDYLKPSIRLSAMMEQPVIYVFTHDSIAVGEDGPTHQPIEQLSTLRATPGVVEIRPADAAETADAWRLAMQETRRPTALILSRQGLPVLDRTKYAKPRLDKGGYVLSDCEGTPQVILIGTGGEVALCLEAAEQLTRDGIKTRVVNLASWAIFERQSREYRDSVLPPEVDARVAVEQAHPLGWERYVGRNGAIVGMNTFGASAPLKDLLVKFGFTVERVVSEAKKQL